jgi:hypothetical protein
MSARLESGLRSPGRPAWAIVLGVAFMVAPVQRGDGAGGTPIGSYSGMFRAPMRLAVNGQDNLYVTDPAASQVVVLNASGQVVTNKTGFNRPLAVAVGHNGAICVSEEGTGRVGVYDAALNFQFALGTGAGEFQLPNHIAVDTSLTNGLIYVTDSRADQVRGYRGTTLVTNFGVHGTAPGQFDFPTGVSVSPAGEVFVVDQNNDRVQVFNRDGVYLREFPLATPFDAGGISGRSQGIEGSSGSLFVADTFQGEVKEFDAQGNFLALVGVFGERTGELRSPADVAVDGARRLFVASPNSGRVEIFSLAADALVSLQVVSAYGVAVPAVGIYSNLAGMQLTNIVSAVDARGTTQYLCTGWSLAGNDPASGSTNVVVMTHTNNAVLTWLWKTQYWLTASAAASGSVSPTGSWWDAGSTATVTATADAFYHFTQWTGTVSSAANPLPVPMTLPQSVVALFAENLAANGTPEWWLASYGLTNGTPDAEALADQDTDGVPTWQEWAGDTIPTNGLSFVALFGVQAGATGTLVRWHGGQLATQYVETADALIGTQIVWRVVGTNPPPTTVSTNLFDPSSTNDFMLYRIRAVR